MKPGLTASNLLNKVNAQVELILLVGEDSARSIFKKPVYSKWRRLRHEEGNKIYYTVEDPTVDGKAYLNDLASFSYVMPSVKFQVPDLEELKENQLVCLDLETNGLNPNAKNATILSVGLAFSPSNVYVMGWLEFYEYWLANREAFSSKLVILGQNIKFDLRWLYVHGIKDAFKWRIEDTQTTEYLLDENKSNNLNDMIYRYTNMGAYGIKFPYDLFLGERIIKPAERGMLYLYNGYDVAATYEVKNAQPQLKDRRLYDFELTKAKSLGLIETNGMRVDADKLKTLINRHKRILRKKEKAIKDYLTEVGLDIDINSPKQLGQYIYDFKKYPEEYTDKGNLSTSKSTIENLAKKYPEDEVLSNILEYRKQTRLIDTYLLNLKTVIEENGEPFVYPTFWTTRTATARLSSGDGKLNFQNFPPELEELFISRFEGGSIIKLDYSQVELGVLAYLSNDEAFKKDFSGEDLHQATADRLGITRAQAKTSNFEIVYGGGSKEDKEAWFRGYPDAKAWMDKQKKKCFVFGYTQSPLGHVRRVGNIRKLLWIERLKKERQGVNAVIQGFAANITCILLILLEEALKDKEAVVVNTIHDATLIDAPAHEVNEIYNLLKELSDVGVKSYLKEYFNIEMDINLKSEIKFGPNWGECG